jgi:hypothetical protein
MMRDPHEIRLLRNVILAIAFIALMSYLLYTGFIKYESTQHNLSMLNITHPTPQNSSNSSSHAYNNSNLISLLPTPAKLGEILQGSYIQSQAGYLSNGSVLMQQANRSQVNTTETVSYTASSNSSAITTVTAYIIQFNEAHEADSYYLSSSSNPAVKRFNYSGGSYEIYNGSKVNGKATTISLSSEGVDGRYVFLLNAVGESNATGAASTQFNAFNALSQAELSLLNGKA